MTRRLSLYLFVALFAAAPLAAQSNTEPAQEPEMGERMERAEEGTLSGTVVLLDDDNLIIATDDGDRAFSIGDDSELPAELRDADDWATFKGAPVRVAFVPGADGELRVVRTLTLLPTGELTATTTTTTEPAAVEPMMETDLADQSDVVEPTAGEPVDADAVADTDDDLTLDTDVTTSELTAGEQLAAANPQEDDEDFEATTTSALADDDDMQEGETLAGLPATASPLPWLALVGTLALLAALALGRFESRRRRVTVDRH